MSGDEAPRGAHDPAGRAEHDECDAGGQPDALEHLLSAAHELLQAMRVVIEAADDAVEHQRARREPRDPEPRLRRIVVE